MEFREKPLVTVRDEGMLFKIIRTAFNQRRKTLRNSLDGLVPPDKLNNFLQESGIDKNIRPEDLSLQQFARLSDSLDLPS